MLVYVILWQKLQYNLYLLLRQLSVLTVTETHVVIVQQRAYTYIAL